MNNFTTIPQSVLVKRRLLIRVKFNIIVCLCYRSVYWCYYFIFFMIFYTISSLLYFILFLLTLICFIWTQDLSQKNIFTYVNHLLQFLKLNLLLNIKYNNEYLSQILFIKKYIKFKVKKYIHTLHIIIYLFI